ncbi:hypothetical protein PILCRDRAFT_820478 [Piloderma croceum F 1598]|uniref:Uncharacterized protein n=1 Tax=Piloderma croceum (strain F 1598) TaxID=765440 RepID=A0A0C3B8K6_PILCF|nr:hypothetical protein PILCRDRAFT_820478 [Piloderma croceum F 1598]
MDQDRIVIDHAGDYNGNGSDQDPFVPSPMDSVHRRTTLSTPSPHVYRASQSNDNNVLHLNGLDDRAKEHLTAFVECYSMARSEIVQLRTDKEALQARCEKEADAAKQLLQEKHALQKAMGELLPREDILNEYQRSVQNARALVADYSDGSVRSSDGSCVVQ